MSNKKLQFAIRASVLLVLIVACNLPAMMNEAAQGEIENQPVLNVSEEETGGEAQPEPPPEPKPEPEEAPFFNFDITDLCSEVPPNIAEEILGQPVEPVEGPGTCLYSNGMASITISVLEGESAKNSLASQILQLETDCSMSFSYSSDQPDPTPLPPEADPLLALSLPELLERSLVVNQNCGASAFETLTEYGPGVYLAPFELFMPGGQVSIVTEEYSLTILYTDVNADAYAAVEVVRQILGMLASLD